ncbi:MAG: YggS family pyridoxal phosphate-dependent enzyme [Deltaproteobacteria bacterium]|jgi:pyridoxal phosphate enzyme (YggS family)|nr:YggS family pyridoxal phosphate-dependent enzyme [Deltaproteobacteria bacterium]
MSGAFHLTPIEAAERLSFVRAGIARAAERAGRDPAEVTLLAVSKTHPPEAVERYLEAGQQDFGESYIQEAREKIPAVREGARWHYIGHLQTNKAKHAARLFPVIHALDSLELASELNRRLISDGKTVEAYIQVNVSGEGAKSGMPPEALPEFLDALSAYAAVVPVGLMTMPPFDPDPEAARPHFRRLRELRDRSAPALRGLSMGMSGDYEVAVEEGSTVVRVGTALFGPR